ncbi:MAG: GNAT family N-acetyltransferase [Chloroflexota bacterium]|nr:GNAT family N-acetyltransferase [Chloroflexota bacterium]
MASIGIPGDSKADHPASGLRPVNLHTDLAALADLIELAFAETMDSNGRSAIREMRALSGMGVGRALVFGLNELAAGVNLGFVWVEDGRVVGNASIYPASLPAGAPRAWIIANVAVHPDYRGRGIASALMSASMDTVRARSGSATPIAILQVHDPNAVALHLYERLGFTFERKFTTWRAPSMTRIPPPLRANELYITRRRPDEWRAEYALAQAVRPNERGGVGWLRPTVPGLFRKPLWVLLGDMINLRAIERLIVRGDGAEAQHLSAALWIETGFATSSTHLTLLCDPDYTATYGEALLHLAIRRFALRTALTIEHPADDEVVTALLRRYGFSAQRTLVQMRWHGNRDA